MWYLNLSLHNILGVDLFVKKSKREEVVFLDNTFLDFFFFLRRSSLVPEELGAERLLQTQACQAPRYPRSWEWCSVAGGPGSILTAFPVCQEQGGSVQESFARMSLS